MTNDDRTGAFWERHDKLMQDPEHEARFNTELARIRAVDAQANAAARAALERVRAVVESGDHRDDWVGTYIYHRAITEALEGESS